MLIDLLFLFFSHQSQTYLFLSFHTCKPAMHYAAIRGKTHIRSLLHARINAIKCVICLPNSSSSWSSPSVCLVLLVISKLYASTLNLWRGRTAFQGETKKKLIWKCWFISRIYYAKLYRDIHCRQTIRFKRRDGQIDRQSVKKK